MATNTVRKGDIVRDKDTKQIWEIGSIGLVSARTKLTLINGNATPRNINAVDVEVIKKAPINYGANGFTKFYLWWTLLISFTSVLIATYYLVNYTDLPNWLAATVATTVYPVASAIMSSPLRWAQSYRVR